MFAPAIVNKGSRLIEKRSSWETSVSEDTGPAYSLTLSRQCPSSTVRLGL